MDDELAAMNGEATPREDDRVESVVSAWKTGDRLAFALWAEFGHGDPDDTGRPRVLGPDDPYWIAAADRLRERFPDGSALIPSTAKETTP